MQCLLQVVLTIGYSETTQLFLESTIEKGLDLQVVVAECAPQLDGHKMAQYLSTAGIQTTVIPDAAVFAMMARVNQVGSCLGSCSYSFVISGDLSMDDVLLMHVSACWYSVPFLFAALFDLFFYILLPVYRFS